MNRRGLFLDLVISGCDFSGTSTQINDLIGYFNSQGKRVRDLRGTEIDALFHAKKYQRFNQNHSSLKSFLEDKKIEFSVKKEFLIDASGLLITTTQSGLRISSLMDNEITEYIDPNSADVWILEEPTNRGAGQTVRKFELYRSKFGDKVNPISAALAHQAYRSEEFFRFRKVLREEGKIIIRSRSEESACYQILDRQHLPDGISQEQYLSLSGHQIAFGNSPTNIFLIVGPEDWKQEDYIQLRSRRCSERILDDHEKSVEYQLMVNRRYATNWLEELYEEGCRMHGGKVPEITRFSIYDSKKEIKEKMTKKLELILKT